MIRTVAQMARFLGVDTKTVKEMAWAVREHLSSGANPGSGKPRQFTVEDSLSLAYACYYWEDEPDMECIQIGLNRGEQFEEEYRQMLYLDTPIFQDIPEDIDETWRHGFVLQGGGSQGFLELARSYRAIAQTLLDTALDKDSARDLAYPVLFAYRHTLELYLKILGQVKKPTHSLANCVREVEKAYGGKISAPARGWILELDKIDPAGTTFRYVDGEPVELKGNEYWVDLVQFSFAMDQVFRALDKAAVQLHIEMLPGAV